MKRKTFFPELKELFRILQGPRGCLWDRRQTHESLLKYLREETAEFIQAVRSGDSGHMREELGDILLQVMFHAQIASRQGRFDIEDVMRTLIRKLKRRHPHVFGGLKVSGEKEIVRNWHRIKAAERARPAQRKRLSRTKGVV